MKKLIFCFDGTWNRLSAESPTNVVLMAESIKPTAKDGAPQIVYYDEGVGTSKWDRFRGGAFGIGLTTNIIEEYRFIIFNYEPNDQIFIFIFIFSRGEFTARSFAGFVRHVGILDINSAGRIDEALRLYKRAMGEDGDDAPIALTFRAKHSTKVCVSEYDEDWRCKEIGGFLKGSVPILKIKYVGVWDTVGALGYPSVLLGAKWLNRKYKFHDVKLTSKVESARHALALDERRLLFRPTVWNNVRELNSQRNISPFAADAPYQQRWFPGVHCSVGGGFYERGLSDGAFAWILSGARRAGLEINVEANSRALEVRPDPISPFWGAEDRSWHDRGGIGAIKRFFLEADRDGPQIDEDVSAFARRRWYTAAGDLPDRKIYRPGALRNVTEGLERGRPIEKVTDGRHTVVKGDTLAKIAQQHLGDKDLRDKIFNYNLDLIDDPTDIHVGWELRIPQG